MRNWIQLVTYIQALNKVVAQIQFANMKKYGKSEDCLIRQWSN